MACLAHIRRNFHDIVKTGPQAHAALLIRLIASLYRIEEKLREAKAGPALREAVRASQSRMIYERLGRIMNKLLPRYRPQHPMAKALAYGISNWQRMGEYLRDGRLEIDNKLPVTNDPAVIETLTPARLAESRRRKTRVA